MGIDFTVFKGSESGDIVEAKGHREVGPRQALIQITHSGVCGTDEHYRHQDQGLGHEGVGIIREIGSLVPEISDLKVGDRVGMGWIQKVCLHCTSCLTGRHSKCLNSEQFGMQNLDQGCFSTGIAWDVSSLFKIPDEIDSASAGPLMCGGATVWAPLYEHGVKPGDRVGILGVGGLGHLAIQFASKMGLDTVVFSGTESKKEEALKLGATEFYATKGVTKFEGVEPVDFFLVTTSVLPDSRLMARCGNRYLPVLAPFAKVFPLTVAFDPWPVPILPLLVYGYTIVGSGGAHPQSMRAMLTFAAKHNVRPVLEKFPMTKEGITAAMKKLDEGKMRYRAVVEV